MHASVGWAKHTNEGSPLYNVRVTTQNCAMGPPRLVAMTTATEPPQVLSATLFIQCVVDAEALIIIHIASNLPFASVDESPFQSNGQRNVMVLDPTGFDVWQLNRDLSLRCLSLLPHLTAS